MTIRPTLRTTLPAALLCVLLAACGGGGGGGGGGQSGAPGGRNNLTYTGVLRFHHDLTAADGWPLGMWEYYSNNYDSTRPPVIMAAGFLECSYAYDLPQREDLSLARYLALRGWHVWVIDLRGSGTSHLQPIFTPSSIPQEGWAFSADDYIHYDLPAAVQFVKAFTGRPEVLFVGHSFGAAAMYGYLETESQDDVAGMVSLGGVGIGGGAGSGTLFSPLFGLLSFIAPLVPDNLIFPLWFAAIGVSAGPDWLFDFLVNFLNSQFGAMYWNAANMTPEVIQLAFIHALANTSTTVLKQWLAWEQTGEVSNFGPNPNAVLNNLISSFFNFGNQQSQPSDFYNQTGFYSYTSHLADIQAPMLVVGGEDDEVAPIENVTSVFNLLGSPDKQFEELSPNFGYSADYGHLDMLIGQNAPTEVYPLVNDWLMQHR